MNFEQAWLNYTEVTSCEGADRLTYIYADIQDRLMENSVRELQLALEGMTGRKPVLKGISGNGEAQGIHLVYKAGMPKESYHLYEKNGKVTIEASDSVGILYGTFALLREIRTKETLVGMNLMKAPDMPLRMLNHWDNMDGSIERGYSGESFFFVENEIVVDERTETYVRLAASIGINAVVINNVNVKDAATWLITGRYLGKVRELAELFAGYGIRLFLSLNYAAPV